MHRLLLTASRHFAANGYERTSLDAIAEDADVSKVTIYSYFPSKKALFEATITNGTEGVFQAARMARLDPQDPAATLTRVGSEFIALMRDEIVLGHHRTLFGSAPTQPLAGKGFFEQGPKRLIGELAQYLRAANKAGSLKVGKPDLAADQFLALFLGGAHIAALLGLGVPTAQSDSELLKENVKLFLARYGL